jgi:hypothetical protein
MAVTTPHPNHPMTRSFILLLAAVACLAGCTPEAAAEQYGFVALLGRDTVSIERISRTPRTLISDDVDRFPIVRQRHTVIDLGEDGKLTRMVMDVRTPSGRTPAERGRQVTANFTKDSVMVIITDSGGVSRRAFRTGGALTVPHVSMLYSVIELEIASALRRNGATVIAAGDSSSFRQFYPDRDVGPDFVLHSGWVFRRGRDSVVLRHDWLSGSGDVIVDTLQRMMRYSGMRSTYKVAVRRIAEQPDIAAIGARFAAAEALAGASQLSVRDTARATIGKATITIDYGRPLARGRTLLGDVITYDRVWRTGANAATQFTTSVPITIGGIAVPAGTHTLWTVPHASSVDLIVNAESGQWGTQYSSARDIGTTPMRSETADSIVDRFTISVRETDARHGMLSMQWGPFRWTAPIVVR